MKWLHTIRSSIVHHKLIWGGVGMLVAAAVVASTVFFWPKNNKPTSEGTQPSTTTSTRTPAPNPTPSTQQDQSQTTPPNQTSQTTPTPTPPPSTKDFTLEFVGLNAHIETHDFYIVVANAGSDLNATGQCKVTLGKAGSSSKAYTFTTQPDVTKQYGYTTWCSHTELAARQTNNTWQYNMTPGTWTVTIELSSGGKTHSVSKTVVVQQL